MTDVYKAYEDSAARAALPFRWFKGEIVLSFQ